MKSRYDTDSLGNYVTIRTGNLDANANEVNGIYPFFTCAVAPLRINSYSFDCECVLIAGNGDLNVKYYDGKFDAYQRTYVIESLDKSRLAPRYLFHFLSVYIQKLRAMSIGGVIKYIKLNYLTDAEIPLPSLDEQHRIAAILDKADAIRLKRQESISLTEEFLRSVFLDMFGDPVTNPKGWTVVNFGELCEELRYGTSAMCHSDLQNGDMPVLRIPNIIGGKIKWKNLKYAHLTQAESDKLMLIKGDILFVRTNGNPEYIGRCAVYEEDKAALFASYLIRARLKKDAGCLPSFINSCISFPSYRGKITAEAKTTAGNYNINTKGLRNLRIPVPPLKKQENFAMVLLKASITGRTFQFSKKTTDNLFNSLVQRAFRGEL